MTQLLELCRALDNGVILCREALHSVFRITGADSTRYLQGRLTQDIKRLTPGSGARTLLLSPQGRVQGHGVIYKDQEGLIFISDLLSADAKEQFLAALLQFKVADRVEVTEVEPSHALLALVGKKTRHLVQTRLGCELPETPYAHTTANVESFLVQVFNCTYAEQEVTYLLLEADALSSCLKLLHADADVSEGRSELLELVRIEASIPRMGVDLSEKVIGPELALDELVSFTKGCYAGQEVVEMAIARGRPNRLFTKLTADFLEPIPAGTKILTPENDKPVGTVTSSVVNPLSKQQTVLAFVKSRVDPEAKLLANSIELERAPN